MGACPAHRGVRHRLVGESQHRRDEEGEPRAHRGVLESGRPVDHGVDWHPAEHDEIPIAGVLRHVDEALAFERSLEHDRGQHQRIGEVGDEVERVQAEQHPHDGAVRTLVPAYVERREFERADDAQREPEERAQHQPDAHLAQVLVDRSPVGIDVG